MAKKGAGYGTPFEFPWRGEIGRREVLKLTGFGVGAFATAGTLAACGEESTGKTSTELTSASFLLNWAPNAEHAPYYLGKAKGFYEKEGVDLEIRPGTGSFPAARQVAAGDSMFGVSLANAVLPGRAQGIPVVSLAVLLQKNPIFIVSPKEKGIKKPTDLYGKRVAVSPGTDSYFFWKALVAGEDLDVSRIKRVPVGEQSLLALLIADKVDASSVLLTNEGVQLQERGYDLNLIDFGDYDCFCYGQTIISSDKVIQDSPDLTRRVLAATLRAWRYSLEHVDEAIEALVDAVPDTDKKLETAKWEPIKELALGPSYSGASVAFGSQSLEGWKASYETLRRGGGVKSGLDVKELFTSEFQ